MTRARWWPGYESEASTRAVLASALPRASGQPVSGPLRRARKPLLWSVSSVPLRSAHERDCFAQSTENRVSTFILWYIASTHIVTLEDRGVGRARITVDVPPDLKRRVRIAAAFRDETVKDWVERALLRELREEEDRGYISSSGSKPDDPREDASGR